MFPSYSVGMFLSLVLLRIAEGKWVEGRIDTKEKWAFLSRFCFLSLDGQFEYLIEFDKDMGTPSLLLYYDDDSQWPAVYHSSKTCKERENVLNKAGQNQIIKLSHWYPDTEYSGCVITRGNKELPASKSSTTTSKPNTAKPHPTTEKTKNNATTVSIPHDPSYYEQFLKTTTNRPKTTVSDASNTTTTWYEVPPTDNDVNSTAFDEGGLWESVGVDNNGSHIGNLKLEDVELMFSNNEVNTGHKIKRSTLELYERYRRRRLNSSPVAGGQSDSLTGKAVERLTVSCHNSRRFRSARERWWFIAISNCDSPKGLDIRYKFLMTNGPDGDFWHEHFSADEFYVLPVLLAYTFAYVIVMVAVVMCSVELRSRHLLHTTYKLYLTSIVTQHLGVTLRALAAVRYAVNGFGGDSARVPGEFLCGLSEMTFLLLLVLMAKGYTITRGRLKLGFTIRLTVFMCCYCVTYVTLFIYQAKAFDPGEVLYLYESPAGYGLVTLRVVAWCMFAYATFFTVRKFPEKNMFYCPFSICGTLWFFAGPLFILTANSYIDKWVRESVVTAVLLFITFSGHIMFLLLTLPVFANKNFPYHVRTTQIGVMEVTGNGSIDNFGHNPYHPSTGGAQTVIIPLTRRTEELIGNMYSQYMATAPPALPDDPPKYPGLMQRSLSLSPTSRLIQQSSTETNTSEDINPTLSKNEPEMEPKPVFTVENQMAKLNGELSPKLSPDSSLTLPNGSGSGESVITVDGFKDPSRSLPLLRSRRNILDPIRRDDVPSWSLAKGPSVVAMIKKTENGPEDITPSPNGALPSLTSGKKLPAVKSGLPSSGEISTITEGREQSYNNTVSKATIDLFNVGQRNLEL